MNFDFWYEKKDENQKTGWHGKSCGCIQNKLIFTDFCRYEEICENVILDKLVDIDEPDC